MPESMVLQLIGLSYLLAGFGMLFDKKYFRELIREYLDSKILMYIGGYLALLVGFLLIAFYNAWVWDWSLIITLLGWLALAEGVVLVAFPSQGRLLAKKIIRNFNDLTWPGFIIMTFGAAALLIGLLAY